jgi:hypothetical protein
MPKCLNDHTKTYKGDEPSPKGFGYCAFPEEDGKIMLGKDNKQWKVKLTSNGQKRWYKTKEENSENKNTVITVTSTIKIEEKSIDKEEKNIESLLQATTIFDKSVKNYTQAPEIIHSYILLDSSESISGQALLDLVEQTLVRPAIFHNIVDDIFPNYQKNGYIGIKNNKYNKKIGKYISENPDIQCGDILFIGPNSASLPRDEDGFCIVLNNANFEISVGVKGPFLALHNAEIFSNKVSYKSMFESMKNDEFVFTKFFNDDESYDDFVEDYKKNNMW